MGRKMPDAKDLFNLAKMAFPWLQSRATPPSLIVTGAGN